MLSFPALSPPVAVQPTISAIGNVIHTNISIARSSLAFFSIVFILFSHDAMYK